MKTSLDCIPCLVRQALDAGRLVSPDPSVHEQIVRDVLLWVGQADLRQPPPVLGQHIHRRLREMTGVDDVYRMAKDRLNRVAMGLLPELQAEIAAAEDPFALAVRLALAGNVIDLGVSGNVTEADVRRSVDQALREPVRGRVDDLRRAAQEAGRILYLADNAGELVFDRLLIEQLGPARVTVAVRGAPVLNDATMADARAVGLHEIVTVIDNGSDAPGTILDDCSPAFRRRFAEADLVIAKGQGNFETLSDEPSTVYFLFKVKCPVIAARVSLPVQTHVVARTCERPPEMRGDGLPAPDRAESAPVPVPAGGGPDVMTGESLSTVSFTPIGVIHSEHSDLAQTPIQPVYAKGCRGTATILPEYASGLQDLDGFSHVYLVYHLHRAETPRLLVKPFVQDIERGVFATRAPCRPNPIGLSIVEIVKRDGNVLHLDGLDVLDGTPLLDIKPYCARFDCITGTRNGWQDDVDQETSRKRGARGHGGSSATPHRSPSSRRPG